MSKSEELVILDGIEKVSHWPLALAESLLNDPTPWGNFWPGHPENGPTRQRDYYRVANCVNGYHRHPLGSHWKNPLIDEQFSERCSTYTTQELLDGIFWLSRAEHFSYGVIRANEAHLRQALQEVVHRVHSATPPTFLLASDQLSEERRADGETKER